VGGRTYNKGKTRYVPQTVRQNGPLTWWGNSWGSRALKNAQSGVSQNGVTQPKKVLREPSMWEPQGVA